MKATPDCDRCFLRQAAHAARLAGLAAGAAAALLDAVADELRRLPTDVPPPLRATRVHALVRAVSGHPDPYYHAKQQATAAALALYPRLKRLVATAADPFATAVRLAIAGNIIDLGVAPDYDLEASIERVLREPLAIDHLERLRAAAAGTRTILYLLDNAGETVLDRLLIEQLPRPVTCVAKGGPAVNDATREDAAAAGLAAVSEIIDNGGAMLGTLLDQCSPALRHRLHAADLVVAKGMANYESLSGSRRGLFFLLQAKCAVIAAHLGVAERALVVLEDAP